MRSLPKDLNRLPKLRDSLSFLYIEHAVIEQDGLSIVVLRKGERVPVPIAAMTVLMLGPGVRITHAAVKTICDNGCTVIWCGEFGSRFYAVGMGETRSAANLLMQAKLCMDEERHMEVVRRMYVRRFPDMDCSGLALRQIRGLEGIRVREAYRQFAGQYGVPWKKRSYKQEDWDEADPINRALSVANSVLYGICQAAIVSLGFSPGLGFIHTGKMLSFVYDIADLYKLETSVPAAFSVIGGSYADLEREVRTACRRWIRIARVLKRIPEDIAWIFEQPSMDDQENASEAGSLWDRGGEQLRGGHNYAEEADE